MHKIWAQMEALVDKGLVKSIGVSNFNVQAMWDLLTYCRIKPVVNEVELHPYNVQESLVKFLKQHQIVPVGYCPIARGINSSKKIVSHSNIFEHPTIAGLISKYEKTGAQILLNWGVQRGHIVIPKSSLLERQKENIEALSFKLTAEEVESVSQLDVGARICDANWLNLSIFA